MPFSLPTCLCALSLAIPLAAQTPPIESFRGRVLDVHGQPITGARVAWVDAPAAPSVRTDADGRYEIGGAPEHLRALEITAPKHARVELRHHHDRAVLATATLPAGVTVIGRLRDPEGGPVRGATVTAADMLPNYEAFAVRQEVRSDERGFFRLDAAPDSLVELSVSAPGFAPARLLDVERTSPLDLTLQRAQRCAGQVVDAEGRPAPCWVIATAENGSATWVETDDGRFELWVPPDLRYRVRVQASGGRVACSELLRGDHGELALHLGRPAELGPAAGEIVRVRAHDTASGEPLTAFEAHVSPHVTGDGARSLSLAVIVLDPSQPDGTLELDLASRRAEGQGAAWIRARGYADAFVPVPPAVEIEGVAMAEIDVAMLPERTVSGTVFDELGAPVPNAWVWTVPKGIRWSARRGNCVRTAADGTFTCRGLTAAEYALQVEPEARPGAGPLPFSTVDDHAVLDVHLQAIAPIRIEWANPPEARAWELELRPKADGPEPLYTGGASRHETVDVGEPFSWATPTMHRASVVLQRVMPGRIARQTRAVLGVVEAGSGASRFDLSQLQTGRVEGRVALGATLPSARLVVVSRHGHLGVVGTDGTFDVVLPAGNQLVAIHDALSGETLGNGTVHVRAGESAECAIDAKVGTVVVTVDPGPFATTSAHRIVARRTPDSLQRSYELERLAGPIRLLLRAGTYEIGLQRSLRPLTAAGSGDDESEVVGIETVVVEAGDELTVTLREPERRSDAEICGDR